MVAGQVLGLRRRVCQYPACGRPYYVCPRCDRGQRCCSEWCRLRCRREQCCAANRRYQKKFKARLAHSRRQRAYCRRRLLARLKASVQKVTDQGLGKPAGSARVSLAETMVSPLRKGPSMKRQGGEKKPAHGWAQCCICGRRGFLIRDGGERWRWQTKD
jgi:hypothetical protein